MKVLVLGGGGYIGSILCEHLLESGYEIKILDNFIYGRDKIDFLRRQFSLENQFIIQKSLSDINTIDFEGVETVIDLVGFPNDPTAEFKPDICNEVAESNLRCAELSAKSGVKHYIYMSSCSVYGDGLEETCTEETHPRPLSVYAENKLFVEEGLKKIHKEKGLPITIIRNATTFGLSYRNRYDLFINTMCIDALIDKRIQVYGDGMQLRPIIHVRDVAQAIVKIIDYSKASGGNINYKIFNLGSTNVTIIEIAEYISNVFNANLDIIRNSPDKRNYKVSYRKFNSEFKEFSPKYTYKDTVNEFLSIYQKGLLKKEEDAYSLNTYKRIYNEQVAK